MRVERSTSPVNSRTRAWLMAMARRWAAILWDWITGSMVCETHRETHPRGLCGHHLCLSGPHSCCSTKTQGCRRRAESDIY